MANPRLSSRMELLSEAHHPSKVKITQYILVSVIGSCFIHIIKGVPKSGSPALSHNALVRLGVPEVCYDSFLLQKEASSDAQECDNALARMSHSGHHAHVKTYTSTRKGKEPQRSHKNC